MENELRLTPEAVQAIIYSVMTGPNCSFRTGLKRYLNVDDTVKLSELSPYFIMGPDTFLIWYAVTHNKRILTALDIAAAYCLNHLKMVMAAGQILKDNGFQDDYFARVRERGYRVSDDDIAGYLFSCGGKVGEIASMNDNIAEVKVGRKILKGVVIPQGLSGLVVVHFATAIASLTAKDALKLRHIQQNNSWFVEISRDIRVIDYHNFCGGNLTKYAAQNLHL